MTRTESYIEGLIQDVAAKLPGYFTRKDAEVALNGMVNRRTLANLDCLGTGPGGETLRGRRTYEKEEFLLWLRRYFGENHHTGISCARPRTVKEQGVKLSFKTFDVPTTSIDFEEVAHRFAFLTAPKGAFSMKEDRHE